MIRIRQIKVPVENKSIDNIKKYIAKKLRIEVNSIKKINIIKESIDARNKNNIFFIYEVDILTNNDEKILKNNKSTDVFKSQSLNYFLEKNGTIKLKNKPVIVGSGPSGLYAAYILIENGISPIIIERGKDIDERQKDVDLFWNEMILNVESNVQFGLGGAGTFSDGKLNTLVKDQNNRARKVLETFVKFGANEDILYSYKPHIGTDILKTVIKNMKNYIIENGGNILFNTKLTNLIIDNNKITGIEINNNEIIKTNILILALGNSARDTFRMLYKNGLNIESKPFAVGVRCEHNQKLIDESQYGKYANLLHPATYKLTYTTSNKRGVYSFCMCPGGYVINASSNKNELVVNGMSYHNRDSVNSNSAIIVTVTKEDFGYGPLDGIKYQENLEKACFNLCNGYIPIQKLIDFKNNIPTTKLGNITPINKGKCSYSNLNEILPKYISDSIKEAFNDYGKKIKHFDDDDVILSGIETRSSCPIRIIRNENMESNIEGIYPIGEGSGYSGGITTSAVDGVKVAEIILKKYK